MLLSKRIDALILVSSTYAGREGHPEDVEYIKEAAKQTPVFLINGFIEGKNIYCSFCDDFKATYDVTSGFIRRGKKNSCVIPIHTAHRRRWRGMRPLFAMPDIRFAEN